MKRSALLLLALWMWFIHQHSALGQHTSEGGPQQALGRSTGNPTVSSAQERLLYGIGFSPYISDMRPGQVLEEVMLDSLLGKVADKAEWIRTYGLPTGMEHIGRLAHEHGLRVALGAALKDDPAHNEKELNKLIAAARAGEADIVVVGNEFLLESWKATQHSKATRAQHDAFQKKVELLKSHIARVRHAIHDSIPVTTGEIHAIYQSTPQLCEVVDMAFVHVYAYWEGLPLERAMAHLNAVYNDLKFKMPGKQLVIAEIGWPSNGGGARTTVANAGTYLQSFLGWAHWTRVPYFYFEAFDEAWKIKVEGPVGGHWGIMDGKAVLKPGFADALKGGNWRKPPNVGSGEPSITLMQAPTSSSGEIKGRVVNVDPAIVVVDAEIMVAGTWYSKPTDDDHWLNPDPETGIFSGGLYTGGLNDHRASEGRLQMKDRDGNNVGAEMRFPIR